MAVADGNIVVTVDGTAQTQPVAAVQSLTLTGGDGSDTFTIDPSLAAAGVPITIDGGSGSNDYKVGDSFGNLTINAGSNDTLDFTTGSATPAAIGHPDAATFTSANGTLTVAGPAPQIDVSLADPGSFTGGVQSAIDTISSTIETVAASAPQLAAPIPLLDPSTVPSADALVGLSDSFKALAADADSTLATIHPSDVSQVVQALQSTSSSLPQIIRNIGFSSAYGGSNGHLLVYVVMLLAPLDAATCTNGIGCIRKAVAFSLDGSGVSLVSTDGQVPTLDVGASVGLNLAAGVDLTGGGPSFVRPDGSVAVAVAAANPDLTATVTDGTNQATVSGPVSMAGTVALGLSDPAAGDNGVLTSELSPSAIAVSSSGTSTPIVLTGTTPDGSPATLTISSGNGSMFASGSGSSQITATLDVTASSSGAGSAAASDPAISDGSSSATSDTGSATTVASGADPSVSSGNSGSGGGSGAPLGPSGSSSTSSPTSTSSSSTSTGATDTTVAASTPSTPDATTVASSTTSGAQATNPSSGGNVDATGAGATGATGSSTGSSGTGSTTTSFDNSSAATTTPTGVDGAAPSSTTGTASGLSPPAGSPWTIVLSDASHIVTLAVDATGLLNVSVDGVVSSRPLANLASLSITGGAGDDSFTLGSSALPVSLDGGGGTNTLFGPAADTQWSITGANSGTVGSVSFANFQNLTGAADNKDTFTFEAGGYVNSVDGGAGGFDALVLAGHPDNVVSTPDGPQSGTLVIDGHTVAYSGLEPMDVSGTHVTINGGEDANASPAPQGDKFTVLPYTDGSVTPTCGTPVTASRCRTPTRCSGQTTLR